MGKKDVDYSTGYVNGKSNGIYSPQEGLREDKIEKRKKKCRRPFRDFGSALGWGEIGKN